MGASSNRTERYDLPSPLTKLVVVSLPEPRSFRLDNRTLYFDSVSNRYGVFLRISQVWSSSRTAITIPGRSLNKFREIIDELAESISSATLNEGRSNERGDENEPQQSQNQCFSAVDAAPSDDQTPQSMWFSLVHKTILPLHGTMYLYAL